MEILETLKQKVSKQPLTLVFPEGDDSRVVNAAVRLAKEELLTHRSVSRLLILVTLASLSEMASIILPVPGIRTM